ncbi:hypothetical protein AOLI_G00278650 [Acnodon oligacanthus]
MDGHSKGHSQRPQEPVQEKIKLILISKGGENKGAEERIATEERTANLHSQARTVGDARPPPRPRFDRPPPPPMIARWRRRSANRGAARGGNSPALPL